MDPLTWTGALAFLNPIYQITLVLLVAALAIWIITSVISAGTRQVANADGSFTLAGNPQAMANLSVKLTFLVVAILYRHGVCQQKVTRRARTSEPTG